MSTRSSRARRHARPIVDALDRLGATATALVATVAQALSQTGNTT